MRIDILTILPGLIHGYVQEGMIGRAVRAGHLRVDALPIRDFAVDRHRTTDDRPYGGGPGQVMKAEPLARAVRSLDPGPEDRVIFLTPQGAPLTQKTVERLAEYRRLILVCGRYEGVDQRFRDVLVDEEISIGDYILTGGELPALVLVDAVARLLPGVLGNARSAPEDSFSSGLLEHPQYTKPRIFEERAVPDVLLSGDHAKIRAWQREQALERTRRRRPDLYAAWRLKHPEIPATSKRKKKSGKS